MHPRTKTITLAVSLLLNALGLLFIALALSGHTASLAFYDMDRSASASYTTAAVVVSFPSSQANAVLGPVEISLKKGQRAALQFSAVSQKQQANYLLTSLYDRSILRVEQTGFGIIITALEAGETAMQSLSDSGVITIAAVSVSDE
jgi:hypothetical protein